MSRSVAAVIIVVGLALVPSRAAAYSVLAHESNIDALWDSHIRPLLAIHLDVDEVLVQHGGEGRVRESNFDGYVYFVNVAPSGRSAVIYPDARGAETNNRIRQRQRYVLPRATAFEFVNDEKGIEVIQVVMSRQTVSLFEDAIKNSRGELGTTASTAGNRPAATDGRQIEGPYRRGRLNRYPPDNSTRGGHAR